MKANETKGWIFSILLVFNSFCTVISFAQKHMDFGIKAGLSIPDLTTGNSASPVSSGYNSKLGPDAAVHIEFRLSKHFSLQPQLQYSAQGGKKDGTQAFAVPEEMASLFPQGQRPDYLYANYKSEAKMNYLMLPIFAKYHLDFNNRWAAYVAAGPFVSYLLKAKNITKGSSILYLDEEKTQPITETPQSFNNDQNITDDLHRFNSGVSGHLGLQYKMTKESFFIEVGGNYGLIDIQKDTKNGTNKTGAAAIDIGYQFKLRG